MKREMKEYDKKCENMKKIIEQALIQKAKQDKILDILKKKEVCIQMLKHVLKLDKKRCIRIWLQLKKNMTY